MLRLLMPEQENTVYKYIHVLTLGELGTMLWLVVMGANDQRKAVAGS